MSSISKPYTWSAGAVIVAAEHNSNFDTIYSDYVGNITNVNIASGAAIVDTKLATISTTGKVNISALTVSSQAQGDIIYASSASAWARLGPGTSGQFLKTQGAAANPIWADVTVTSANLPTGTVVQVVNTQTGDSVTGSNVIPNDDSIPQITEGDEYFTRTITPSNANNKLKIMVVWFGLNSATSNITVALFQDSTANALAAGGFVPPGNSTSYAGISFVHFMTAGTTSSTTFRVRAGGASGTTYMNGGPGGTANRLLGGVMASSITIEEIKA